VSRAKAKPKAKPTHVQYRFELPIQTETQLRIFVEKALGIRIPNQRVCPGHVSPWEAFRDAYFAKHSIAIWEASRGFGGKSHLLAALGTVEAWTLQCDVNLLGGSGEQARRVLEYMDQFFKKDTAAKLEDDRSIAADTISRGTRLAWGNKVTVLMASQTSVRGPHIPRLRLDELDEVNMELFSASLGQTMDKECGPKKTLVPAQTVLSSTHQHPDGTMTEALKLAAERGWGVYRWCYKESLQPHGWLSQSMVAKKKNEMTATAWRAEVELQEPNPEDRAIMQDLVEASFGKSFEWCANAEVNDQNGVEYIFEQPAPPVEGAEYVHGADWARTQDWTVIVTLRVDVYPARVVAFYRGQRLPWPVMVRRFDDRIEKYGGRAAHDQTGIGDVVAGYLSHDAIGVTLGGRIRAEAFNAWVLAFEHMEVVCPMIRSMYQEHKFCSIDDLYGAGHPPDTFVAGAMAWYAKKLTKVSVL
jgi:hypothetical protein